MSTRATFRRLLLILTALATFAMLTGLTGACAEPVAGAHLISAPGGMAHATITGHPAMPREISHGVGQLCQAWLPPASLRAAGFSAVLDVIAPLAVATPRGGLLLLAIPARWQPPLEQSSLCVWRI